MSDENYLMQQAKKASYEARQDVNFYKAEASTAQVIANDLMQPYISLQIINVGLIEMMDIAQKAKGAGRDVSATISRLLVIMFEIDKLTRLQSDNHNLRYENNNLRDKNHLLNGEVKDLKHQLRLNTAK